MRVELPPAEREVWNRAIEAAATVCREVDQAAHGQGHAMGRPRASPRNPHGHRSGEISLGATRCLTGILELKA